MRSNTLEVEEVVELVMTASSWLITSEIPSSTTATPSSVIYIVRIKKEIHVNIHSVPLDYNPTEMLSNENEITMAEWRVHRQ